jgi:hypothetical protein
MGAKEVPSRPTQITGAIGVLQDFPLSDMSFLHFASPPIQGSLQLVNTSERKADAAGLLSLPVLIT